MASSDPLKEFLQNTGWSCDELLHKLLEIKSQSSKNQEIKNAIDKRDVKESVNESKPITTSKPKLTAITTNSNVADKDFSDTDDDEKELIITSKHIIEEIIEDMSNDNSTGQKEVLPQKMQTKDCEPSAVIELDSEDEDDNFEEECCHSNKNTETPTNSKISEEKSSDVSEKSKLHPHSTFVIEDDHEKSAAGPVNSKNGSDQRNEILTSISIVRTDSDKVSTDDDLEVISIEDVYEIPKQMKSIQVVRLGKSSLSSQKVQGGVRRSLVETAWQLPKISSIEGGIDSKVKLNTSTPPESTKIARVPSDKIPSRDGHDIPDNFNINSDKSDALTVSKGCSNIKDQILPCVYGETTKAPDISRSLKNEHTNDSRANDAGEKNIPSIPSNTDFEDVINAFVMQDNGDSKDVASKPKQPYLVQTARLSVQKPSRPKSLHADGRHDVKNNKIPFRIGKKSNKKRRVIIRVPPEIIAPDQSLRRSDKKPLAVVAKPEDKCINTSGEICPAKSVVVAHSNKEGWQLPTIISVEGAVEVDKIQTNAAGNSTFGVSLLKKSDEDLLSSLSQETAPKTVNLTIGKDTHALRKGAVKPSELVEGTILDKNKDFETNVIGSLKTPLMQMSLFADSNQDGSKTVKDLSRFLKYPPGSPFLGGIVEDNSNVLECFTEKPSEYLESVPESSELSSTVSTVNNVNVDLTEGEYQDGLKTVEDVTVSSADSKLENIYSVIINCSRNVITKSASLKKDIQNQDPVLPKTSLECLSDSLELSSTVDILDESNTIMTRHSNQDAAKTRDDLDKLLERTITKRSNINVISNILMIASDQAITTSTGSSIANQVEKSQGQTGFSKVTVLDNSSENASAGNLGEAVEISEEHVKDISLTISRAITREMPLELSNEINIKSSESSEDNMSDISKKVEYIRSRYSVMESNENSATKINSLEQDDIGNKDNADSRKKVSMSNIDANPAVTWPRKAVEDEHVEYCLVDANVTDTLILTGDEFLNTVGVNTSSNSSADACSEYIIKSLEDTSAGESASEMTDPTTETEPSSGGECENTRSEESIRNKISGTTNDVRKIPVTTTSKMKMQPQKCKKLSIDNIIQRKITMNDLNANKEPGALNENEDKALLNKNLPSKSIINVIQGKIIRKLVLKENTTAPNEFESNNNDKGKNNVSSSSLSPSVFSESAKVSKLTSDNEIPTKGESTHSLTQSSKNMIVVKTAIKNNEKKDPKTNDTSMDLATNQDTVESEKNHEKGEEIIELSKEPSTSTWQKEEVIFAVPKLPPLKASTSKNNELDSEAIRMNLKRQLDSLRNRRRQHVKITTKIDDNFLVQVPPSHSEKKSGITKDKNCSELLDQPYTQTNELGLMILDVKGGVEFEEPVVEKPTDADDASDVQKQTEEQEKGEKNEVEDLVRQIISKKGELRMKTLKDLAKPSPVIDEFEIFQKQVIENVCELRPSTSTAKTHDQGMSSLPVVPSEEKSPFVSDSLDEFLTTGDAQLNVSYNIPKCGAEEGLKELRFESESAGLVLKKMVYLKHNHHDGTVKRQGKKVRTLAQKRKLLEKQMAREKRQQEKEQKKIKIKKEKKEKQKELEDKNRDRSYVIAGGKKIWVHSIHPGRCIANIDEPKSSEPEMNLSQSPRQKKISLLENLQKKYEVRYSPGPLSKKNVLQVSGTTEWKTEVKLLPKIFVEVVPKLGHALPHELLGRIDFEQNLSENHIEFALTALKIKNQPIEPARKFILPVRYNKSQRQIVVRKKLEPSARAEVEPCEKEAPKDASQDDDDGAVISKVVEDLINYVEIKELAPSLIKEDDYDYTDDSHCEKKNKEAVVDEHLSVMKRSYKKKSKVDAELLRLSCKIVNVEVEKEEDNEKPCNKPYCRLGCVCKSLRCENTIIFHCQNERCMFDCACPKQRQTAREQRVTLPAGTNILSVDTVTRIEDEAKKHLARVEREFTQTIIQTSNRTIVVGANSRSKIRRAAQQPKKYNYYVDDADYVHHDDTHQDLSKECMVKLTKLNLDAVIPYCLRHNLYDCFCHGLSDYQPKIHLQPSPSVSTLKTHQPGRKIVDKGKHMNKSVDRHGFDIHSELLSKKRSYSSTDFTKDLHSNASKRQKSKEITSGGETTPSSNLEGTASTSVVKGRSARNKKAKWSEHFELSDGYVHSCSRTRGVTCFKRKKLNLTESVKNDFVYMYNQSDLLKIKTNYFHKGKQLEVDILKQTLLSDYLAMVNARNARSGIVPVDQPLPVAHLKKRKQTLEVRTDLSTTELSKPSSPADGTTSPATPNQQRKSSSSSSSSSSSLPPKQLHPVFEGEIIINESSIELLRKMGSRTVADGYARLLPWRALCDSFKSGTISLWCMIDQPSRLLINKSDKRAPKNYIDIRQTRQPTEVIEWILRNKLPPSYQEENVSFILREMKDNFEICGVCTKNLDVDGTDDGKKEKYWGFSVQHLKHRDMVKRLHSLTICAVRQNPQTLVFENAQQMTITAHLPKIGSAYMWRLIHLKYFSYMYFMKSNYSIKYVDLMMAIQTSKSKDATLVMFSDNMLIPTDHPKMAIYFDQQQPLKLFVGPYLKSNPGGNFVMTMRYVNQKLVCTEDFNKISGFWLFESGGSTADDDRQFRDFTIDLTMDENETEKREEKKSLSPSSSQSEKTDALSEEEVIASMAANVSMMHENAQIEIVEAPPRKPEEFNRFVITNIPHFGYLGAFKHPTSDKIDVSWPFENKLLRFPSVKIATEFLQERLSSLLLPVPDTFKIHVIAVNDLDTNTNLPIDANVLSGHYICGEFGYYNILTITPKVCLTKLNRTREELMRMFAKRCQMIVKKRAETLASLLHLAKPTDGDAIIEVNSEAVLTITKLKMLERHLMKQKMELMAKKRRLATELFMLIKDLPERERNAYSVLFRNILTAKHRAEPIEIASDSGEEREEEEKERGPPVLEAEHLQPLPHAPLATTPSFEQLPVLEKQLNSRPQENSHVQQPPVPVSKPVKHPMPGCSSKAPSATTIAEQRTSEVTPHTKNPRSLLRAPAPLVATATLTSVDGASADPSTKPCGTYIKGVKVVKRSNGQFMIVPDVNKSSSSPTPLVPAQMKVVLKSKNGAPPTKDDSGTPINQMDDSPTEEPKNHPEIRWKNDPLAASFNPAENTKH